MIIWLRQINCILFLTYVFPTFWIQRSHFGIESAFNFRVVVSQKEWVKTYANDTPNYTKTHLILKTTLHVRCSLPGKTRWSRDVIIDAVAASLSFFYNTDSAQIITDCSFSVICWLAGFSVLKHLWRLKEDNWIQSAIFILQFSPHYSSGSIPLLGI